MGDMNNWATGWNDWNAFLDETGGPNWANNQVDAPIILNTASLPCPVHPAPVVRAACNAFYPCFTACSLQSEPPLINAGLWESFEPRMTWGFPSQNLWHGEKIPNPHESTGGSDCISDALMFVPNLSLPSKPFDSGAVGPATDTTSVGAKRACAQATGASFYKQPMFYALAHFSAFVPPGSYVT